MSAVGALPAAPTRISFSLSPTGTSGACLVSVGDGPLQLEHWSFDGPTGTSRILPGLTYSLNTQLLALDDGSVLVSRTRGGIAEVWQLASDVPARRIAAIRGTGLSLLPVPAEGRPVVAIAYSGAGRSSLWRMADDLSSLRFLHHLPTLVVGGTWLDPEAGLIAVDAYRDGVAKASVLDIGRGTLTPLLDVTPTSNDRVLAASPESGLMLVSTDAVGGEHIGWVHVGRSEPARFPPTLHQHGEVMRPVCVDPAGRHVLLHCDRGARSHLAIYTPADDTLVDVAMPEGRAIGLGRWSGELIRMPFSAPTAPTTIAATVVDADTGTAAMDGGVSRSGGWARARLEGLPGAADAVETIVYGDADWRTAEHVVLALHGGPRAAWQFDFDPLFQRFAAAGIAIAAPNQRGSTGYGVAHTNAIKAAWGGPDLADILRIGADIRAARAARGLTPPVLFGASYGAYLALLAACCGPQLWAGCVALAPFTSARRLYADGPPTVRELIDMYDARTDIDDDIGPRDLLRLCADIAAPVLLAHGEYDEVIPVEHSRALARKLRDLGRQEGRDFRYVEVPQAGHDLTTASGDGDFLDGIIRFLLSPTHDSPTHDGG